MTVAEAKTEVIPNLLTAVGDLAAVHQVNVTSDVSGRVTAILFQPGAVVKAGDPLVQLNDAPEKGDLANSQAMERVAASPGTRQDTVRARLSGRQVVDQQQSLRPGRGRHRQGPGAHRAEADPRAVRRRSWASARSNSGGYLNPGGAIVTLTDLSELWANFTLPEKVAAQVHVGQAVELKADAYPGRVFKGRSPRSSRRSASTPATSWSRRRSTTRTSAVARHVRQRRGRPAGRAAHGGAAGDGGGLQPLRRFRLRGHRGRQGRQGQPHLG